MTRIATFNLENLFTRPVAMDQEMDSAGREALEDFAVANNIAAKAVYTLDDKTTLLQLTAKYQWHALNQPKDALIQLQLLRSQLFRTHADGSVEVVANGRADWVGWFELRREQVTWEATYNTGRVIADTLVQPDILITVEVENRPTLERFNEQILKAKFNYAFPYVMLVDGNDQRGIDIGILSKFPIDTIRSHSHELRPNSNARLFSRDCPEYDILLPNGKRLVILPNHLKSKRNGNDRESRELRQAQAERVHQLTLGALLRSDLVLVAGDLNDTPDSKPLSALFVDGFADVNTHPSYPKDRPGTFETGTKTQKIDYLIMSPALRGMLRNTGIERRGSYHPNLWKPFDTVKSAAQEASDHHLLWADFDFGL